LNMQMAELSISVFYKQSYSFPVQCYIPRLRFVSQPLSFCYMESIYHCEGACRGFQNGRSRNGTLKQHSKCTCNIQTLSYLYVLVASKMAIQFNPMWLHILLQFILTHILENVSLLLLLLIYVLLSSVSPLCRVSTLIFLRQT
jgi:hypothetical protein